MGLTEARLESILMQLTSVAKEHGITVDQLRTNPTRVPFPASMIAKSLVMAEQDLVYEQMKRQWAKDGSLKKSRPQFTLIRGGKE